jgi:uncharacterized protein
MKILIAGGSGFLGKTLTHHFKSKNHEVCVLTRRSSPHESTCRSVQWDGRTPGPWISELVDTDVLINLTGKNVNCRYTHKNKEEILNSRTDSVRVLRDAIARLERPVPLWIQSSSATIYRHAEDRAMTERNGEIGSGFSVEVCKAWEHAFADQNSEAIRCIIMRTGIVFAQEDGAFVRIRNLARFGLGGKMGPGSQMVSWLHIEDFVRIIEWFISHPQASGVYNCTAPIALPNADLMRLVRSRLAVAYGFCTPEWLLSLGAAVIGTETELILKSRWVRPERLLEEGYQFKFAEFGHALKTLV